MIIDGEFKKEDLEKLQNDISTDKIKIFKSQKEFVSENLATVYELIKEVEKENVSKYLISEVFEKYAIEIMSKFDKNPEYIEIYFFQEGYELMMESASIWFEGNEEEIDAESIIINKENNTLLDFLYEELFNGKIDLDFLYKTGVFDSKIGLFGKGE